MIAFLKGEVAGIYDGQIVLEVNGVGYNINMPASSIDMIEGLSELKVYTYLSVREDAMWLYGFLTKDDLDFFKQLIQVNGIGPKGALGILSVMSSEDLKFAILSSDAKTISKCPGIGAKTAQRIILDLKDKIDLAETFEQKLSNKQEDVDASTGIRQEAVEALCALGYSATDALRACRMVELGDDADAESILKEALKHLI
ncbi:MAG: Holliday junction branch migration protein RuvA [Lachnospiraceae bacterium]|nr:Holliday junction branch migration protein RuvA [Lachnospiraceae bacterium]MCR4685105.1 Holliday junction branch migration protein RuvA [Lachnospiraceae bacterium]